MIELTKSELYNEILRLNDENDNIKVSALDIVDVYNKLKTESNVQKYNKTQLISLVDDIFYGLGKGETKEEIFRTQGATKHLNYFDNFLERGESDKVIKAINNVGGSTDILKGIKPYKPQDFYSPLDNRFKIEQEWSDGSDGTSPHAISFDIYFEGEKIYHWGEGDIKDFDYEPEYTLEDYAEIEYERIKEETSYKAKQTLSKETITKFDYSYVREAYKTSTDKIFIRKRYAKGTIINGVKVGGRFI